MSTVELYWGNCLDIISTLPRIDAVICDPPYGKTAMLSDQPIDPEKMWSELYRNRPGVVALFGVEPFSSMIRLSNIDEYKYDWYWIKNKKTNFLNAGHQPLRRVENISVFYYRKPIYNPQKTTGHEPVNSYTKHTSDGETVGQTQLGWSGGGSTERYPDQCLYFPVVNNDGSGPDGPRLHPLQKPVALMEYLVATYTNPGELVLDFAAGSGTTAVACVNLGRDCILIENDGKYMDVIRRRIPEAKVHVCAN